MTLRTVTIHAATNDLIGDETYEAWLKHAGAWTLVDAGDVEQIASTQDFVFPGLTDGDNYSLQLRMKRAGRYRIGYLSSDPETWPAGSRIDFTPGSLIAVGPPTLDAVDDWVRTDADHSKFQIHITPDSVDHDLQLIRDGVVIHTFVAPLASPIIYDDVDPVLAEDHAYRARHISGTLAGPTSATITKFAGPPPATSFIRTTPDDNYGEYTVEWTNDGRAYRLEDDYLCVNTTFTVQGAAIMIGTATPHKTMGEIPGGAVQMIFFRARIRAEVTSFGVTDVSDWLEINIVMTIDDPDVGPDFYNSCP